MHIAHREVSASNPPLVVAEIGINHGGDLRVAMEMVRLAAAAGCECVKHQTRFVDDDTPAGARVAATDLPGRRAQALLAAHRGHPEFRFYELDVNDETQVERIFATIRGDRVRGGPRAARQQHLEVGDPLLQLPHQTRQGENLADADRVHPHQRSGRSRQRGYPELLPVPVRILPAAGQASLHVVARERMGDAGQEQPGAKQKPGVDRVMHVIGGTWQSRGTGRPALRVQRCATPRVQGQSVSSARARCNRSMDHTSMPSRVRKDLLPP